jgi:hypothetical protein
MAWEIIMYNELKRIERKAVMDYLKIQN